MRDVLKSEPRVAELPFDSDRKLMSTIHKEADGTYFVAVKGAPDQLLKRVTRIEINGEVRPITDEDKQAILATNKDLAKQALRVLMMAYKTTNDIPTLESAVVESDLIFSGLVGMIDPERPEAAEAVRVAKEAGIRPIMITGDHQDTAEAIAKRLGIIDPNDTEDHVFTGAELNELSDEEFQKVFKQYSVYARVSPEHKVRIVKAWQNDGKVVVTDTLPAIALGVEPAEPGIMTHKPRGRQSNFFDGGVFGAIMYQGVFQTILVLAVYGWGLAFPEHHTQAEIHADALTMAFATLGLIQLLHAFNVKSVYQSVFKVGLFRNKTFNWAIPVAFVLLMATIVVPGFNNLFHVSHLSLTQWLAVIVGSFLIVVLVELVKAIQRALGKDKDAI